ncbi:ABC-F family ATP-binding cassette domain-containing protein [Paenibacillus polymyxa]|uniref:ABC-F family ATP-binding cassette domain-containing protein n=1 Tax=Paenibacillus polymyxa TaxID=1406 RepID=A0A8I1LTM0_PAEPO|nr:MULTISPECIES: ABC-F family ATP-binding cassette domain-containing protein [Paenibacillus]KAF6574538.1 ABC-F family ATP-binding cassette domain-containing protein [Paenibacillus sp. EKM206P]KAF6589010.1 ABC-F family ATP-binding cassette domain-containing protein [Paenibacillus sp. EKM205P]MBM0633218.1 ABC-F family ATP-binding cassette domain-containing protein [Paenibacillus polymyxa]
MNIMTVEHITKSYGEKMLFEDASFGMDERDKIGVVGVNGTGKSTFLRVISGLEPPDDGNIAVNNDVRIQYLAQNPEFDPEMKVLQHIFHGSQPEMKAVREYTETMELLELNPGSEELQKRLLRASQQMDTFQAWQLESEAKNILTRLGITQFESRMGVLSGGQRKRVALAAALIQPCELLILDEPTNHIDNESVEWLEQYLQKRRGALLMITHDRYFLDRVANVMLELDHGRLFRYEANYTRFLELKAEREEREASTEQKRKNLLRNELAWIRRGAKARSTKQKARIDRYEQLRDQQPEARSGSVDMSVASTRLGKKILEIEHLSKSVDSRKLIQDLSYIAVPGDRVGILGPNGSGKSTLLQMIAQHIEPDSGNVVLGPTVKLGYFTQEHQEMNESLRVIEYIKEEAEVIRTADGSTITAAQMLERFLFAPSAQWTVISRLSGGEKRRLYLLRILMSAPNVLLLDEPTNDLDIQTLSVLEDYLDEFPGVVFIVSHDRYFLDRTVDKILAFEGDGQVRVHVGDYSEYAEWISKNAQSSVNTSVSTSTDSSNRSSTPKSAGPSESVKETSKTKLKFTFKEQREYEQIDELIEQAEQKLADIQRQMEESFSDSARLQELMAEQAKAEQHLEHQMERWTYLNELAEQIEQSKS